MITPPVSSRRTVRCAVIGQPIAHSKSPVIHLAFAAQCDLPLHYDRIDCAPGDFAARVHRFFADGGRGLNVTLPHKAAALALADRISNRARMAGAANTLGCDADGRIWADNTDGIGLLRDLQRLGVAVAGQRLLLLGAGGAAAGLVPELLAAGPAVLAIANRGAERAAALKTRWPTVRLAGAGDSPYTLVISSVSDGAAELLAGLPLAGDGIGYDLNYGDRAAPTLAAMRARGLGMCHDGRGMLIEQAAESFRLWHGRQPDTRPLHAQPL